MIFLRVHLGEGASNRAAALQIRRENDFEIFMDCFRSCELEPLNLHVSECLVMASSHMHLVSTGHGSILPVDNVSRL